MTYRVNMQFKTGSSLLTDVIDAALPQMGETIAIALRERKIPARVVAIWAPWSRSKTDGLIVVEAQEL